MKIKDLKISIKLGLAFGLILMMLLIIGFVSLSRSLRYAKTADMAQFMLAKEVDHFKWSGEVQKLFTQNLKELSVETDPTKCGFGKWYYEFINSRDFKLLTKDLQAKIKDIEQPHKELHETAIEIGDNWQQAHAGLEKTLLLRLNDHRKWSNSVLTSLLQGRRIDVETDPTKCAFGQWLGSEECQNYIKTWPEFAQIIEEVKVHHEILHQSVIKINALGDYNSKIATYNNVTAKELEDVSGHFQEIINLENKINQAGVLGLNILNTRTFPALNQVRDKIEVAISMLNNEKRAVFSQMVATILFVILIGILIVIGMIIYSVKGIAKPITKVVNVANEIADGDLTVENFEVKSKDELGMLMESFNKMLYSLKYKLSIIKQIAEGAGDFTINVELSSDKDEFGKTIAKMLNSLNEILGQVNSAIDQVTSGSAQVAQASQSLSQGATEQASSLEEITSGVTQISSQSKQNAENGNKQMQELVAAMNEINKSADMIKKIVKVIDDIAFQTNLLALNANVEAARAGKYGKGFAVVAEEVRNLAGRSAESVSETTQMVEEAIKNITSGNNLVEVTAKQLGEIMEGANKVSDLVDEIATASKEQTQGLDQINQGLGQIDQVTQSNTASAEESASASEELASQAEQLKAIISRFKLVNKEHVKENANKPLSILKDGIHKEVVKLINREEVISQNKVEKEIDIETHLKKLDKINKGVKEIKSKKKSDIDFGRIEKQHDTDFGKF